MPEEILPSNGPDWPDELREPVARLGKPTHTFATSRRSVTLRIIAGTILLVLGIVANYFYWFVLGKLPIPEHVIFLILFGMPFAGCTLLVVAWRDRGLWVLVFPTGILRWQRGIVQSFPWDEVEAIYLVRVLKCDPLHGRWDYEGKRLTAWIPWDQPGYRLFGAHLLLQRTDGVEGTLPPALTDFAKLNQLIQEAIYEKVWPEIWERFLAGEEIEFGDFAVSVDGIRKGDNILRWKKFQIANIDAGKLVIRAHGKWRPWADLPIQKLSNPHLFLALVEQGATPARKT